MSDEGTPKAAWPAIWKAISASARAAAGVGSSITTLSQSIGFVIGIHAAYGFLLATVKFTEQGAKSHRKPWGTEIYGNLGGVTGHVEQHSVHERPGPGGIGIVSDDDEGQGTLRRYALVQGRGGVVTIGRIIDRDHVAVSESIAAWRYRLWKMGTLRYSGSQ